MKGIIFTEFTEMIESEFGLSLLDEIIETSKLPSKGIYTSVGTYSHHEIMILLTRFNELTKIPIPDALKKFGNYLFKSFANQYPDFLRNHSHVFAFLESVEDHIHVEVLKLYPDAQLPHFEFDQIDEKTLLMEYHSDKHLVWLAIGLIENALKHFNVSGEVKLLDPDDTLQVCRIQVKLIG